jgi:hypothetical protein
MSKTNNPDLPESEVNEEYEAGKEEAREILNDYLNDPHGRSPMDVLDEISSIYDEDIEDLLW